MQHLPAMHAPPAMKLWCTLWLSLAILHQRQESLGFPALHSHLAFPRKAALVDFTAPWPLLAVMIQIRLQQRILQPPSSQRAMRRSSSWCRPRLRAW